MSLFKPQKPVIPKLPGPNVVEDNIPVAQFDLGKRYDIYCTFHSEDRLYEDVKIIGMRTLERITEYSPGAIGGYVEIESTNGTRAFIPQFHVSILCEHGAMPAYKVIRRWAAPIECEGVNSNDSNASLERRTE